MTPTQYREFLHRNAPLVIHVGARKFPVKHTDFAMISPNQKLAVIFDEKGGIEVINLSAIDSITVLKKAVA